MKKFNWLILCALVLFSVGVGCSTITPNQIAPTQTADSNGGTTVLKKMLKWIYAINLNSFCRG